MEPDENMNEYNDDNSNISDDEWGEGSESDDGNDYDQPTLVPKLSVRPIADVADEMKARAAGRLNEVWGFTVEDALTLLLQFDWNEEKVEELLSGEDGLAITS
jgi:ariadne-1